MAKTKLNQQLNSNDGREGRKNAGVAMVKIETKGDVRVIPCPKCGTPIQISNQPPSTQPRVSKTCSKCHTGIEVARKP